MMARGAALTAVDSAIEFAQRDGPELTLLLISIGVFVCCMPHHIRILWRDMKRERRMLKDLKETAEELGFQPTACRSNQTTRPCLDAPCTLPAPQACSAHLSCGRYAPSKARCPSRCPRKATSTTLCTTHVRAPSSLPASRRRRCRRACSWVSTSICKALSCSATRQESSARRTAARRRSPPRRLTSCRGRTSWQV